MTLPLLIVILAVQPQSGPEVAPPPRPAGLGLLAGADPSLADWTPRPPLGKIEPWEKLGDKDWIDPRFREMNTGPVLNCTMRYTLGKDQPFVYKAAVVRLGDKGDAGMVFDRATMRLTAAWTGGYLNHSERRFGLLNTPTPKGDMVFASPPGPGWADPDGKLDANQKAFTAPLDPNWARYRGMYVHGNRVVFKYTVNGRDVLESTMLVRDGAGRPTIVRATEVLAGDGKLSHASLSPNRAPHSYPAGNAATTYFESVPPRGAPVTTPSPSWFTKGGPKRWGEPIVTKLVRGDESGPFALDTLTIPHKNPFNALFFCTGLDFLPDGRVAVCTCHGDVWLVKVDEKAETCSWQRFATGLYHPLGLKVIDGKVVVLERGQLTRLHDLNADGEADFYECVCNNWDTGSGEHSYDTCLETDPHGNFYFFKTGDTDLPTGGCLMRVAKDGSKAEVFCTGFRHPIGMGMSPTGVLTGADQEGNWMPATRIDEYKRGGFYGDMRANHRKEPPKTYDPPICWLHRDVDNSAGGQVWVPTGEPGASATGGWAKSPLVGLPLHFSYGRCRAFVLLRQECGDGLVQGGVAQLPIKFLAGVCRGRFAPDGNLYVCGLNGWQTAAQADGCLQRVRWTGKPLDVPVKMEVDGDKLRLTFSRPLDAKAAADPANYKAAWWNYRWSADYGSKRWKLSDPKAQGQDEFGPKAANLLADGKTVELTFEKLQPVMQMQVGYNVAATDGHKSTGSVYLTIHTTR